jgi:hypothetical protein
LVGTRENTNYSQITDNLDTPPQTTSQLHLLFASKKRHFNLRGIFSKSRQQNYGTNELLYRFGGNNSIRAFKNSPSPS